MDQDGQVSRLQQQKRQKLFSACVNGLLPEVKKMILEGYNPLWKAPKEHNVTCFHKACSEANLSIVKYLITDAGYDELLQIVDDRGETPLHHAVSHLGQVEVVEYLLSEMIRFEREKINGENEWKKQQLQRERDDRIIQEKRKKMKNNRSRGRLGITIKKNNATSFMTRVIARPNSPPKPKILKKKLILPSMDLQSKVSALAESGNTGGSTTNKSHNNSTISSTSNNNNNTSIPIIDSGGDNFINQELSNVMNTYKRTNSNVSLLSTGSALEEKKLITTTTTTNTSSNVATTRPHSREKIIPGLPRGLSPNRGRLAMRQPGKSSMMGLQNSLQLVKKFQRPWSGESDNRPKTAESNKSGTGTNLSSEGVQMVLEEKKQQQLMDIFTTFDADGSGYLDKDEVKKALSISGMYLTDKQVEKLWAEYDVDGSGELDFEEFKYLADALDKMKNNTIGAKLEKFTDYVGNILLTSKKKKLMQKAFNDLDEDMSGLLDKEEVKNAFSFMGIGYESKELDDLFEKFDADGSGELDFEEFCELVNAAEDGKLNFGIDMLDKLVPGINDLIKEKMKERKARKEAIKKKGKEKLKACFERMDADKSGLLSKEEVFNAINQSGAQVRLEEINQVWSTYDNDGSGELDLDEFYRLAADIGEGKMNMSFGNVLKKTFNIFPTGKSTQAKKAKNIWGKVRNKKEKGEIRAAYRAAKRALSKLDNFEFSPLHAASCCHGKTDLVKWLVEHTSCGMELLSLRNNRHEAPLHAAVMYGPEKTIDYLLKKSPHSIMWEGYTPLHAACGPVNNYDSVILLVEKLGPKIIERLDHLGRTCIHIACENGNTRIVRYLVSQTERSVLYIKDGKGYTPMHSACLPNSNLAVVRYLVDEVDQQLQMHNNTQLHVVCSTFLKTYPKLISSYLAHPDDEEVQNDDGKKKDPLAGLMLRREREKIMADPILLRELPKKPTHPSEIEKAKRKRNKKLGNKLLKYLVDNKKMILFEKNHLGQTALHLAITQGLVNFTMYLIEKGFTMYENGEGTRNDSQLMVIRDSINGQTPMHIAVERCKQSKEHAMILDYLLYEDNFGMANEWIQIQDNNGLTPFHTFFSCHKQLDLDILELFLEKEGSEILDVEDNYGLTVVHTAFLHDSVEGVSFLLKKGGGIRLLNFENMYGDTPLATACEFGNFHVIKYVVETLSLKFIFKKNKLGIPVFFNLFRYGHLKIIQWLITFVGKKQSFLLLDYKTADGEKAIHTVCRYGHLHVLKWMLNNTVWGKEIKLWAKDLNNLLNGTNKDKVVNLNIRRDSYYLFYGLPKPDDPNYYAFYGLKDPNMKGKEAVDYKAKCLPRIFNDKNYEKYEQLQDDAVEIFDKALLYKKKLGNTLLGAVDQQMYVIRKLEDYCNPLHLACRYGHFAVVQYLIEETVWGKPLLSMKTKKGLSPYDLAVKYWHSRIIEYLNKQTSLLKEILPEKVNETIVNYNMYNSEPPPKEYVDTYRVKIPKKRP